MWFLQKSKIEFFKKSLKKLEKSYKMVSEIIPEEIPFGIPAEMSTRIILEFVPVAQLKISSGIHSASSAGIVSVNFPRMCFKSFTRNCIKNTGRILEVNFKNSLEDCPKESLEKNV